MSFCLLIAPTSSNESNDPCDYQVYHGPTAFSEPETRNAKWIFDTFSNIGFFIDLHSYSEDILYSWGDDDDQTNNPTMNFQNPAYNHKRGIIGDSVYKEYILSSDLSLAIELANTFRDGIKAVTGTTYTVKSAANLYPTAGTSDDYAYSRHFVDSTKEKVIAYTLEWGKEFQPPYAEMQNIIQEITSGLLVFCLWVCNSLQLSRLADRVESLQSQVKQLQEITSLGIRRKATSVRERSRGSKIMKTKKKTTTARRTGRTKKK